MNLELKHIAPYLPYELNLLYISKGESIKGTLTSLSHYVWETHPTRLGIDTDDKEHIWMFKPILRPLSTLNTKFCETHNIEFTHRLWSDLNFNQDPKKEGCSDYFTFKDIQLLAKFHFDLFGLIDAGLAVEMD